MRYTGIKIIVDQYGLSEPLFLDKQSLGAFRSDFNFNFKLEDIFKASSIQQQQSSSISIVEINNYNNNNLFLNEVLRQIKIKFLIHNDHTNLLMTSPPSTATDLDTPNPNPTTTSDFRIQRHITTNRPRSIYTSTALQIGLLPNNNVPQLLPYILHNYTPRRPESKYIIVVE